MSKRGWVAFGVPTAVVGISAALLWEVSGSDSTRADDYVFARMQDVDCAHLDTAPPMTLVPSGTSDPVVRTAMEEAWETTQRVNTNAEIAAIACRRVSEMASDLDARDRIDVHVGLRRDSMDRTSFARAITSIVVDKPQWEDPREIEGGFIVLGELAVD